MTYRELATRKPFIVNKNLGSALEIEPEDLTTTNADGNPVVIPTQKQKYDFDRNGWLLIPNLLTDEEVETKREFCKLLSTDPTNIALPERGGLGGPLQELVDHPVVVGFMNEFLAYPALASEDCYGFRLEETDVIFGTDTQETESQTPNNKGNGLFRLPGDSHIYRCVPGRGWSGLTRAIWELTDVDERINSFKFISGSHKSAYPLPDNLIDKDSSLWETYECPQGSLFIFTESITQMNRSTDSQQPKTNRVSVSYLYNTVASRWSNWMPNQQLIEAMPDKRQTLFRDVYAGGNVVNGDFGNRTSAYPIEI